MEEKPLDQSRWDAWTTSWSLSLAYRLQSPYGHPYQVWGQQASRNSQLLSPSPWSSGTDHPMVDGKPGWVGEKGAGPLWAPGEHAYDYRPGLEIIHPCIHFMRQASSVCVYKHIFINTPKNYKTFLISGTASELELRC